MADYGITAAGDALRSYYKDGLVYQLDTGASPTVQRLEKNSEMVEGKDIKMAARYGRSGGVGNRADTGTLPTPNARKTALVTWETKNLFARFVISDKLIKASKTGVASFCRMMEQLMEDLENDAKENLARQVFGDGTGLLATVSAIGGTDNKVLTLDTVVGLAEGMLIDSYTGSTKNQSGIEITAVDEENSQITVDTTGVLADDTLYIAGSYGLELTGLKAYMRPGSTLCGLTLATYPWFKSLPYNLSGQISETAVQKCIDNAKTRTGAVIDWINCSYGVRRAFYNLLVAQKRQVNTRKMEGGFDALEYNGIELVAEKYQRSGVMQFMALKDWSFQHMDPGWDWMQEDGAILHRVTDKPEYEATFFKYADLACKAPKGAIEMYGITEH